MRILVRVWYCLLMNIGDRVLYVENRPIIFSRDLGTVARIEETTGNPVILFDDGWVMELRAEELASVEEDVSVTSNPL